MQGKLGTVLTRRVINNNELSHSYSSIQSEARNTTLILYINIIYAGKFIIWMAINPFPYYYEIVVELLGQREFTRDYDDTVQVVVFGKCLELQYFYTGDTDLETALL